MGLSAGTTWAYVTDMDAAVEFYRDTLRLRPGHISKHWSDFDLGGSKLGLHPGKVSPSAPEGTGWYFGLTSTDLTSLRSAVEMSHGRVVDDYHETPGGVVLTIADPDGNLLQVMQPGSKLPLD